MRRFLRARALAISAVVSSGLPAKTAARLSSWIALGYWPRLHRPRSFNEKILHRKFFDRDPRMPDLIDKVRAKEFVATRLGSDWIIPTYFAGRTLPPREERDWPLPFVIKPNHLSGHVIFVRRPEDVDWHSIENETETWMRIPPHGVKYSEWGYAQIEPQILVEQYVGREETAPLDYKFYGFRGHVEYLHVETDRESVPKAVFYNTRWEQLPSRFRYDSTRDRIARPSTLQEMVSAAELLSADWPFVRVDLYEFEGRPKFGELTFYPGAGLDPFSPREFDFILGESWDLPRHGPLPSRGKNDAGQRVEADGEGIRPH